jgi:hypothetical protein
MKTSRKYEIEEGVSLSIFVYNIILVGIGISVFYEDVYKTAMYHSVK